MKAITEIKQKKLKQRCHKLNISLADVKHSCVHLIIDISKKAPVLRPTATRQLVAPAPVGVMGLESWLQLAPLSWAVSR